MRLARPIPRCRAVGLKPAVESLEQRGLLSVVAPSTTAGLTASYVHRGTLTVAPSGADPQTGHLTSPQASESGSDPQARTSKTVDGKDLTQSLTARDSGDGGDNTAGKDPSEVLTTSLAARDDADAISADRRSTSHDSATRDVADSLPLVERRSIEQTSTIGITNEALAASAETTSGSAADAALEPLDASSLVAWAPGSGLSFGVLGAGPGESAASSAVLWSAEIGRPAALSTANPPGDLPRFPVNEVMEEPEAPDSTWGNLVDRALHGDWDALDGEFRRFLTRLGGDADGPADRGWALSWSLWIGAATVTVAARQVLQRHGRFCRRPRPFGAGPLRHQPVPVGPWPLSSR
jgi:hypothetical protein